MKDVLLLYPNYLSKFKNPPLGLAYLASTLESKGYTTKIVDMNPLGISMREIDTVINEVNPHVVGISFMTNQFSNALKLAEKSKKIIPEVPVVVGGNHVSALPEEIMGYPFIDFAVLREGELTFMELVDSLSKGSTDWETIDGLAFKRDGAIIANRHRDYIHELDCLPFPKWDDFPIKAYSDRILGIGDELPVFSILSSRGCPGRCSFCSSHTVWSRKFRGRSAMNIFNELQFLEDRFGAKHFNFVDDTLTIDKRRLQELCDLIIDANKQFRWIANSRVNTVDIGTLKKMHHAGCRNICFGVESGDPTVRKINGKMITDDQIRNAHRWAKESGLIVSSFFMVGNMGETQRSIDQTITFAKQLNTDHPSCSIATPYPDTRFFKEAEKNGWLITKDWNKYITSPHMDLDYSPVSTNGILTADEMIDAYYKVNAAFARSKLITKYGNLYFIKPKFFIEEIFKRVRRQNLRQFILLIVKLLRARFTK